MFVKHLLRYLVCCVSRVLGDSSLPDVRRISPSQGHISACCQWFCARGCNLCLLQHLRRAPQPSCHVCAHANRPHEMVEGTDVHVCPGKTRDGTSKTRDGTKNMKFDWIQHSFTVHASFHADPGRHLRSTCLRCPYSNSPHRRRE